MLLLVIYTKKVYHIFSKKLHKFFVKSAPAPNGTLLHRLAQNEKGVGRMNWMLIGGLWIPFLGTAAGAGLVLLLPGCCRRQSRLYALSAGAMLACAVWSLLLPALEQGFWLPGLGFILGMMLPLLPEKLLHRRDTTAVLMLVMVLHNIPEGMAVGAAWAGFLGQAGISGARALTLALGIAVQNIPDGAVAAMPLAAAGASRYRAFALGAATGLVEPLAAAVMVCCAPMLAQWLPVLMGFAAGAMVCVVVQELVPQMPSSPAGAFSFSIGFLALTGIDLLLA